MFYLNYFIACNNYQSSWCSIQARQNVKYFGRGWFQLSYPCNYYHAGKALGLNLLDNPDLVIESDKNAASTAIWYYLETGMNKLAQEDNFGGTTRKLNEYECSGKSGHHFQAARVQIYHRVRKCFGLPETTNNLIC
jgi:predicted chitinase